MKATDDLETSLTDKLMKIMAPLPAELKVKFHAFLKEKPEPWKIVRWICFRQYEIERVIRNDMLWLLRKTYTKDDKIGAVVDCPFFSPTHMITDDSDVCEKCGKLYICNGDDCCTLMAVALGWQVKICALCNTPMCYDCEGAFTEDTEEDYWYLFGLKDLCYTCHSEIELRPEMKEIHAAEDALLKKVILEKQK